jgi:dihydrofolate synthase/folylpolyglutamate synthase
MTGDSLAHAPQTMAQAAATMGLTASLAPSVPDALRMLTARDWPTPPRILIAGSLYLAGEVLRANGTFPD